MASDSDTEELFYDATEDVALHGGTPTPSPTKVGPLIPKELGNGPQTAESEAALQEVKQDDPKEIIDNIIEESQKARQLEEDVLDPAGKKLPDPPPHTDTWISGADILQHIPELLVAETSLEGHNEEYSIQAPFRANEVEYRQVLPSHDDAQEHQGGEATDKSAELANNLQEFKATEANEPEEGLKREDASDVRQAEILDQRALDFLPTKDFSTTEEFPPAKPPRQLTAEPDIVASTKKSGPVRPPPPVSIPPPRPPPPARPAPPPRKKKSDLEVEVQKIPGFEDPGEAFSSDGLLSPNAPSDSMAKDSQPSLDLASATSGDKIVTAQENGKPADGQTTAADVIGPQRPRSNSGRELTDEEILASVMIKNLDTGEEIPLSLAEEKLPTGINPLTLHIMRRTKEYVSNDGAQSDDEDKMQSQQSDLDGGRLKQKTTQLKKFLGKSVKRARHLAEEYGERAVNKVKSVRDEVFHTDQDDPSSSDDEGMPYTRPVKFKAAHGFKGPYDFEQVKVVQDLSGEHTGAVWTMKFSHCGRLLASAGQDNAVRIWVLKNAFDYFNNMRMKYNTEGRVSPSPSQESLNSSKSDNDAGVCSGTDEDPDDRNTPFRQRPFCKYKGHTADLLDLSWSKNYFLLSSSMDKTVRLWHISRRECLCCFQHIDFVTAIAFHPRDDRYFLSGSLDGKLRLWNIPDKKVALWNEVDGQTKLITAANFCQNGKYAVIGTYDGRCIFYDTEHLKYHTQIHVRSTRGRNRVGRKITGIEPLPGENKVRLSLTLQSLQFFVLST
ncbi:WD repeat-containing protein 44-like [Sphaerodactylus townsendi]|uniref:WD repeat-containing protein 44-like n=1 Tax=Sphaerodactylus townsendi TaxID=933632 RepID=UPI002025DB7F|nr:WD repeat-containing protein 44-like [Sphaerodactylus townsendi]